MSNRKTSIYILRTQAGEAEKNLVLDKLISAMDLIVERTLALPTYDGVAVGFRAGNDDEATRIANKIMPQDRLSELWTGLGVHARVIARAV